MCARLFQPFYERIAAAIRSVQPNSGIVFYEGVTWDDFFPLGFDALPDADRGLAAISYHYYDLPSLSMDLDVAQRVADMARLRAGALCTEFAMYPDGWCTVASDLSCMRHTLDVLEHHSHGYLGWEYASLWQGNALNESRAYEMARPFPMAVGGHAEGFVFDHTSHAFTLNFTVSPGVPAANVTASTTVVFASLGLYFPQGLTAAIVSAPADAVHSIALPCWAGAGFNGALVNPPGMGCAAASPTPTPGAPAPYAYAYVVLDLTSATGGRVSLRLTPL
jgi:hypothetical protein